MTRKSTFKHTLTRLRHAACAFGLLISLAALPALGQQIHQLSYNGSNWSDQNLNGAPAQAWAISAFFTTPNDQLHVFYGDHASKDLHDLFYKVKNGAPLTRVQAPAFSKSCGITVFPEGNYRYV